MHNPFTKHPKENRMKNWFFHLKSTLGISIRMFISSTFFLMHGIFPFIKIPKYFNFMEMILFLLDENNNRKKENE